MSLARHKPAQSELIGSHPYRLRNLAITGANQVLALDTITILVARGFVYLTAVADVASRLVLAHRKVGITLEACHAVEIPEQAFTHLGRPEIVNADQGSQCTAEDFTDAVLDRGSQLSMDGRGAWRDTVFVGRLWRSVQPECRYLKTYDGVSAAWANISRSIDRFNTHPGIQASTTSRRWRPTGTCCQPTKRLPRVNLSCTPSCPPPRSFVVSDAPRIGQLCTVPTRPDSTHKSRKAVQTSRATSLSLCQRLSALPNPREEGKTRARIGDALFGLSMEPFVSAPRATHI